MNGKNRVIPIEGEEWRYWKNDIYVSDLGRAKKIYLNGRESLIGYRTRKGCNSSVHIKTMKKFYPLTDIIWSVFVGPVGDGVKIIHIDGDRGNNCLSNLKPVNIETYNAEYRTDCNKRMVYDANKGRIFKSVRAAAKALYACNESVRRSCLGIAEPYMINTYWYDDKTGEKYRGEYRK